ncbi:MAG: IS66 family insertion sequence element accessory protein TnpB [Eubacteriales bacterium]|nr:IS66 family insertion sequence element accessory protein TnpB [Eubacteriales bacterium]
MRTASVKRHQQLQLIMECRKSGLSDKQWCLQHDIRPETFHMWVSRLRKSGAVIPESEGHSPEMHDVVKLDFSTSLQPLPQSQAIVGQNANISHEMSESVPSSEIVFGSVKARFYNGADPALVCLILDQLGGHYAW